jgi:hypothetical protein
MRDSSATQREPESNRTVFLRLFALSVWVFCPRCRSFNPVRSASHCSLGELGTGAQLGWKFVELAQDAVDDPFRHEAA